jgi:4-hydroxybenzoate polyprenyltransferase
MPPEHTAKDDAAEGSTAASLTTGVRQTFVAWCSLLRLPNLLTVPGDPIAGALLAASTLGIAPDWITIRSCALTSLGLYSAALLANDYFDRHLDTVERPERPIPSGRVRPGPVLGIAVMLTAGALAFAAQAGWPALSVALLLALTSWSYNAGLKRLPLLGPLLMGACRALSLILGATAIAPSSLLTPTVLIPAATLGLLIAGITTLARRETETVNLPVWQPVLPSITVLTGLASVTLVAWTPHGAPHLLSPTPFTLTLAGMAVVWTTLLASQLFGSAPPAIVQRNIGGMIRGLVLFQATLCATTGPIGGVAALAILAAFPVTGWLGKCFKGS